MKIENLMEKTNKILSKYITRYSIEMNNELRGSYNVASQLNVKQNC